MSAEQYLESVLRPLMEKPDEFSIERKDDEKGVLLVVDAARSDRATLIGIKGRNASMFRRLLNIYGWNNNEGKVSLMFAFDKHTPEEMETMQS
jgi:predicted RNA-binding protein YlqC (UPF0109 family)